MSEATRMTEAEIKETVFGLVKGQIFCGQQAPPELLSMVFMPLGLGGWGDIDVETVGEVIGDLKDAGPRAINGYPMFMSCRVVHRDDWSVIVARYEKARAALDAAVEP